MDALKNFAYSLVATAPSPATSGTSLVVTAGQGSYFPSTPFDATIWPAGVQPTNSNAEIIRVTAVATDTFTITRAQYGTTAQSIAVGYQIAQTVDANLLNQLAPLSGATFTGEVVVPDLKITGLTGATASSSRLVGTTTSGPPVSGTFAVGDMVIDQTATIWFCTSAGTPGTWINVTANSLVVRSATATAGAGEFTIFGTSGTSGQTITLPATAVNGSIYQIKNLSPYTVNILGGTNSISVSGTIYNATTPYTIPLNAAYTFVYTGGIWYCFTTTDINKMGGLPLATSGGGTGLSTIGTAGQSLVVNSGATGLQYANIGAGPVVFYSASGTALPNETSIATNSGVIVTLPTAPPNGTVNTITSNSATATIARGGSTDTITYVFRGSPVSGTTSFTIPIYTSRRFVYAAGVWTEFGATNLDDIIGTLVTGNGGTGATTASAARGNLGVAPSSVFPTAHGVKAWTFDPATIMNASTFAPVKGSAYATRIHMTTGATVSTIGFMTSAGGGTSLANSYISLYTSAGAVLGYASLGTSVSNTGYNTFTLTSVGGLTLASDTDYFIVLQIGTSSTTAPNVVMAGDANGSSSPNLTPALMNFNLSNVTGNLFARCMSWGSSLNTTPAAVGATTPSNTFYNFFATLN